MPASQQDRIPAERPLLERRTPFGVSVALVLLFGFFFLMPFAFRSARLSLNKKENNIKDWLPADFVETAELEWFADHFVGESFVIATWPGCHENDQRLKLLESKLRHECSQSDPAAGIKDPKLAADYRSAKEYGVRLGLLPASREFDDWGGQEEKWLSTAEGRWYYITPDGRLHRWEGKSNGPAGLIRGIKRATGQHQLEGTFVAAFGSQGVDDRPNPFYNDPSLLCAPMFRSISTGASLVDELAKEGGLLWPVDFTDQSRRPIVARRRAMERLTGSLFAPAVPKEFGWTADEFRQALPIETRQQLPTDFNDIVAKSLQLFADENFSGDRKQLPESSTEIQANAWYAVFDAAKVEPPPRQTCLLITLTDIAQDNLAYAIGRGVLGAPRGRLLELASDSGVQPAAPPSMAPPPFDGSEIESIGGAPPLRLGGPPVDNVAIDEEGTVTLVRLVGYSVLVGVLLSYLCFSSIKLTLMVFIVGGSSAMLSMAFVNWTNGHVDAILMSMPSLVYVLGLSGAIHVINYYRDEVRHQGVQGAAGRALRHAMFPCTLAALTTAIGLGSLYTSNLTPISNFGLYSAIGVMATLAILFTYLPAALQTFVAESKPTTTKPEIQSSDGGDALLSDRWAVVGNWICRHHILVTSLCTLVLLTASLGLAKIQTSVQLLKLFDEDSRIIRDYAWMESHFGKLVPMELVLRVPPAMQSESAGQDDLESDESTVPLNILERVEAVARINYVVTETLGEPGLGIVGSATAVNTFLKPLPGVTNSWNPVRSQYISELNEGRSELLANDYVRIEKEGPYSGSELWRVSLRVGALSDVDYGGFINTLRKAVEPVLRAYDTRDEVLHQIASSAQWSGNRKPLVVMLGAARPAPLSETELVDRSTDHQADHQMRIRDRVIYLAVLEELLRGERFKEPIWVDHRSTEMPIEIGSELWSKVIAKADLVVWVGEEELPAGGFADAKSFVDGRQIFNRQVTHSLVADSIPESGGAGALQAIYTGVVPVVYKAQRTLLGSLVESIVLAFVLIGIVMILLLNPAKTPLRMLGPSNLFFGTMAGIVSMLPNLFPVLLIFGFMGHIGSLVDIGTMMTASVAMGVAVDDTIHFLSWFRTFLDRGYDRIKAVELTYRRVGPAMTQTTIVGGLGLFVFALSTFTPTQRFGTLMLVLLAAALVGDLILLPALLAGPLGRVFKPRVGSPAALGLSDDEIRLLNVAPEGLVVIAAPEIDEPPGDDEPSIDRDGLPKLKLHGPSRRTDQPHRMKGR